MDEIRKFTNKLLADACNLDKGGVVKSIGNETWNVVSASTYDMGQTIKNNVK